MAPRGSAARSVPQKIHALDARSLRGLAHPLRIRLLGSLRRDGPATASQLAEQLNESSGATSYHLRQLAAHGFVEDAPELGKGRERWWRAAQDTTHFNEELLSDADPEVREAAQLYRTEVASHYARRISTWVSTSQEWPQEWVASSDMSGAILHLTPELAAELRDRIHLLIEGYRALAPDEDDPRASLVHVQTQLIPTRDTD